MQPFQQLLKKLNKVIIWPSNPPVGMQPRDLKTCSHKNMYMNIHNNIFVITNMWKQPKYSLMDELMNKMWYVQIIEYHSAIKRKEVLKYDTTWMNLEKNYAKWKKPYIRMIYEKAMYQNTLFIWNVQKRQMLETRD